MGTWSCRGRYTQARFELLAMCHLLSSTCIALSDMYRYSHSNSGLGLWTP